MKVPSANVIVGFDKEVMNRLFAAGSTYESLLKGLTNDGIDDVMVFNSESNPNFISFMHSVRQKEMIMQLKLIDPKSEFERRFLDHDITPPFNDTALQDISDVMTSKANDDVKKSQENYDKEFFSEIEEKLNTQYQNRYIYIAYGSGDNLDFWAGPHRMVVHNIDLTVKGAKEITLTLVPSFMPLKLGERRGAYNEIVDLDLAGLTIRFSAQSKPIEFTKSPSYDPLMYLEINKSPVKAARALNKADLEYGEFDPSQEQYSNLASEVGNFDFHAIIVDTLRKYIQKATGNKNVVVLLPNINFTCRQLLNNILLNQKASSPYTGSSRPKLAWDYIYDPSMSRLGYLQNAIDEILSSFGLGIYTVLKEGSNPGEYLKALPTSDVSIKQDYEKNTSAYTRFKEYFEKYDFYAILEKSSKKGIPDHYKVIKNVVDTINANSKESYQTDLGLYTETDIKLLDFWSHGLDSDNSKSWTFGGYSRFRSIREAIIFGDNALIQNYLYGKADLNAKSYDSGKTPPIHPLDSATILTNKYSKAVREITYPAPTGTGAFGDGSDLSDHFEYIDNLIPDDDYIKKNRIPIFRFNTTNPNVLNLKMSRSNLYGTVMMAGYTKVIERKSAGVVQGILPTDIGTLPIRTWEAAVLYLVEKRFAMGAGDEDAILASLSGKLSTDLIETLGKGSALETAKYVATLVQLLADGGEENHMGLIELAQIAPGNPQAIMSDFVEKMTRESFGINITTIPYFHVSDNYKFNSPCLLYSENTPIKQSRHVARSKLDSFLSGQYDILGWRHIITTKTATSEFGLVRRNFTIGDK